MSAVTTSPGGMSEAPRSTLSPVTLVRVDQQGDDVVGEPARARRSAGTARAQCAAGPARRRRMPAATWPRPASGVVRVVGAGQALAPTRKAIHASLIRSTWPGVNSFMHESCV